MNNGLTRNWLRRGLKARKIIFSSLGGAVGIGTVAFISQYTGYTFIIPPFGATCVIAFVIPNSAFARPRSIIGGHMLASIIGIFSLNLFGQVWWAYSIALALCMIVMQMTRTLHPPAAADPVFIMMQGGVPWNFMLCPVLTGSTVLVMIASLYNGWITKKHLQHNRRLSL